MSTPIEQKNITPLYDRLNTAYDALVEDNEVFHHGGLWWKIQHLGWIAIKVDWTDEKRVQKIMELVNEIHYPSLGSICLQIILLNAIEYDLTTFVFVGIPALLPEQEVKEPEHIEQPAAPVRIPSGYEEIAKPVLDFVDYHLSQQPEASDVVHDLLAFLAEEMLRLNKEKQAIEKAFLSMIVSTLHIQPQPDKDGKVGIEAMKGKSSLINYVGDYQKDEEPLSWKKLSDILTANKKLCQVEQFDRLLFDIERDYHANLDKVLPIKEQLKRTDWLIDETVYKLYGLTDEEIAVVEETVKR